jgi:hypothetical protein
MEKLATIFPRPALTYPEGEPRFRGGNHYRIPVVPQRDLQPSGQCLRVHL